MATSSTLFRLPPRAERALPFIVLAIILVYTYFLFVTVPYIGFDFNTGNARIVGFYNPPPSNTLEVGDTLVSIGDVSWTQFSQDTRQPFIQNVQPGDSVPIVVERAGETRTVNWIYPGITFEELLLRVNSEWWLALIFWVAGTLGMLFLRPRDRRWYGFLAFCYLTAIWLAGGSAVSRWHIWEGAIKNRALVWLMLPAYLDFHWHFPRPLGRFSPLATGVLYGIGVLGAVGEIFQLFPPNFYTLPFVIAIVGSMGLLVTHFVRQREDRRTIGLLLLSAFVVFLPALLVGLSALVGQVVDFAGIGFLAFPALPLTYFYAAARRHLGALEPRANRVAVLYLFAILLGVLTVTLATLVHFGSDNITGDIGTTVFVALVVAAVALLGFRPFERWVERYILGIPIAADALLAQYGVNIATVREPEELVHFLHGEVADSLLIKEALLVRVEPEVVIVIDAKGMDGEVRLTRSDIKPLLERVDRYFAEDEIPADAPARWARVVLKLIERNEVVGLWLLGRRDPDDFYTQKEIVTLRAIANQSAIALTNIRHANQLRELFRVSIERQRIAQQNLARALHDEVLHHISEMRQGAYQQNLTTVETEYTYSANYIRAMIEGLRPPALAYGALPQVLEALVENLQEQPEPPRWHLHLENNMSEPYPEIVAVHAYDIARIAIHNVSRHAGAPTAILRAFLNPRHLVIEIEDDGKGFHLENGGQPDYFNLLQNRHFGLVDMRERAVLITAELSIQSEPGKGTLIRLTWQADNETA